MKIACVTLFLVLSGLQYYMTSAASGVCPKPGAGLCVERCGDIFLKKRSLACEADEVCCSNGCGHVCVKGTECPGLSPGQLGTCVEECTSAATMKRNRSAGGCSNGKICCFNGCGHTCTYPVNG